MVKLGIGTTIGLAGAALAAWYFLDPKKGADRRKQVSEGARDIYSNAGTELKRLGDTVAEGVSSTIDMIGEFTGLAGSGNGTQSATVKKSNGTAARSRASLAE